MAAPYPPHVLTTTHTRAQHHGRIPVGRRWVRALHLRAAKQLACRPRAPENPVPWLASPPNSRAIRVLKSMVVTNAHHDAILLSVGQKGAMASIVVLTAAFASGRGGGKALPSVATAPSIVATHAARLCLMEGTL